PPNGVAMADRPRGGPSSSPHRFAGLGSVSGSTPSLRRVDATGGRPDVDRVCRDVDCTVLPWLGVRCRARASPQLEVVAEAYEQLGGSTEVDGIDDLAPMRTAGGQADPLGADRPEDGRAGSEPRPRDPELDPTCAEP